MHCHQSANAGAKDEEQNHAIIFYAFMPQFFIFALGIAEEQFRPAAEIAGTHGGGVGHTMNLTEALYLHGANEGNKGIGDQIVCTAQRQPRNNEQG